MLDYQRIVDDVRSSLYSHNAEGLDFLRAAAADYSVGCDEVNERLRQCGGLLRKGLRSEAIQLAEIEPKLLDVVALLDFPERDPWMELANRSGIAPPTPLMLDVAADLNEAYAVEQPLAALLQRHRLLALAHGPLSARIEVLRGLADGDANNPVWQDDLLTFEKERQNQIKAEVEMATRKGDTTALAALEAELSGPDWRNPPPPALAQSAADAKNSAHYWSVQSQLDGLAAELESAMSHGRIDLGKTAHSRWNETIANSGWGPHESLAQRAAPGLNWVQEHLDHEASVQALADAVGNERSTARLRVMHRLAVRFGSKLPDNLEERYGSWIAALERAAMRRRWLAIGGTAAGVAAVIMLLGWIVSIQNYAQEVAVAEKKLSALIEHKDLEGAQALVDALSSRVMRDPRLKELLKLFEDTRKDESKRRAEFCQRLETAAQSLQDAQKKVADQSGQIALDGMSEQLGEIQVHLTAADGLARTKKDHTDVATAESDYARVQKRWQEQVDQAFLHRYKDFDERLTEIERAIRSGRRDQNTKVVDYGMSLREWERAGIHVSRGCVEQTKTLDERFSAVEKSVQQQEQEEGDREKITAAVGDIQGYLKAVNEYVQHIEEYIQHSPGSDRESELKDRAAEFKRAVEEQLCWQAMAEWDQLAAKCRGASVAGLSPTAAEKLFALAKTVDANFGGSPQGDGLRKVALNLKAVARRDPDHGGERIEAPLNKLFQDPLVAGAWMVEIKSAAGDVHRYYFSAKPNLSPASPPLMGFHYVANFKEESKVGCLKQGSKVVAVGRAPQALLADQVQPILTALTDGNWEPSFCRMIKLIRADKDIDPILKFNLLQQVLDIGIQGSYCLEKAFGEHQKWIKQTRIAPITNWLNPGIASDSSDGEERKEAEKVASERDAAARKLGDFPDVGAAVESARQDFKTEHHLSEFRWVGWLHQGKEGPWQCLLNQKMEGGAGSLFVVYRGPTKGELVLTAIGQLNGKTADIHAALRSSLAEGRPVYLEVP
jgi:hypothetical protein